MLPDSQCEHDGCFQFTKIKDKRRLVVEIEDQSQKWEPHSCDQFEAEHSTWAAHLASYIGMDEQGQAKTLHRFRDFLRRQKKILYPAKIHLLIQCGVSGTISLAGNKNYVGRPPRN